MKTERDIGTTGGTLPPNLQEENYATELTKTPNSISEFQSTGDQTIDHIIKGTQNAANKDQSIIIINHTTDLTPHLNQKIIQDHNQQNFPYPDIQEPQRNEYSISVNDIDSLSEMLTNLYNIYAVFFHSLPSTEGTKKNTLEHTMEIVQFYAKIRRFFDYVISNENQIQEDIRYLEGKTHLLEATEQDMLAFYNLDHKYYKIKKKQKEIHENLDPNMQV